MLDRKEKTSKMQVETNLLEGQNDGQDADGDEDDVCVEDDACVG